MGKCFVYFSVIFFSFAALKFLRSQGMFCVSYVILHPLNLYPVLDLSLSHKNTLLQLAFNVTV